MYEGDVLYPVLVDFDGQRLTSPDFAFFTGSWFVFGGYHSYTTTTVSVFTYNMPMSNSYAGLITISSHGYATTFLQRGFSVLSGQTYAAQCAININQGSLCVRAVTLGLYYYNMALMSAITFTGIPDSLNEWYFLRCLLLATETASAAFVIRISSFQPSYQPAQVTIDACGLYPAIELRSRRWSVDVGATVKHHRANGGTLNTYIGDTRLHPVFEIDCEMMSSFEMLFINSLWCTPTRNVGLYETLTSWRESEFPIGAASFYVYGRITGIERACQGFSKPHGYEYRYGSIRLEF